MVRLYDTLLQNVKELSEVASQLGGAAGEYMLDECTAKVCLGPPSLHDNIIFSLSRQPGSLSSHMKTERSDKYGDR